MTSSKSKLPAVHMTGPLEPYRAEFTCWLTQQGYMPWTRVGHLQVMAHLSAWMQEHRLGAADLAAQQLEEYLADRRDRGYATFRTRSSLTPLLTVLAAHGASCEPPTTTPSPPVSEVEALLAGYERFLTSERGLASSTVAGYSARARRFLTGHPDVASVTAAQVGDAVAREARELSSASARMLAGSLRWLLRYAYLTGLIDTDLSATALPVVARPSPWLPRGIRRQDAQALLSACDRRTAAGRRDYAVIVVLLRLGLRGSEVAGLTLEDLDWRAGQVTVRGKGHRVDVLPLPTDVGEAITAYLRRGRPVTSERAVFLRNTAPRTGLSRSGPTWIVHAACTRAGIPPVGAHRLRHSLARQLLGAGAPLGEIGQILRHNSDTTVSIYARVDVDRLRTICRPWLAPVGGGPR